MPFSSPLSKKKQVVIESQQRFSKSTLWQWQRDYFSQAGVHAWSGTVPYYITSNPFIANTYANLTIRFIQDHVRQNNYSPEEPFYILELGTGAGKFSFYTLKRLLELQKTLNMQDIKIVYIMSDFTESNLNHWRYHPSLQPFLDNHQLEFACYDITSSNNIMLTPSQTILNTITNPLIVFANYFFDSVQHDVFHIDANGQLHEALTHVETPKSNLKDKKTPINLEKLQISFTHHPLKSTDYYDDPALNQVLQHYSQHFKNTSFLIPIGTLQGLNRLIDATQRGFLLLASDKGYTYPSEIQRLKDPGVVFHAGDCFSMMVNFHATGLYFTYRGGDCFHHSLRRGLRTSAFSTHQSFDTLPETQTALWEYLEHFNPVDFFNIHRYIRTSHKQCDLKTLVSHMHLSLWDPHIFHLLSEHINNIIGEEHPSIQQSFLDGAKRLADHFYPMPKGQDTLYAIGIFFQRAQDYPTALHYYLKSLAHQETPHSLYQAAICYYLTNCFDKALEYFQKVEADNSQDSDAISNMLKEWIERTKKHLG